MLVYWLTLGRAKSRMGRVYSLPLPSGASDIAVHQTEKGEAESRMNWFHRALVQPGILDVLQLLEQEWRGSSGQHRAGGQSPESCAEDAMLAASARM